MTTDDRRALLRAALTPDASVQAPPDLADAIQRVVLTEPQRRPGLSMTFGRVPGGLRGLLLLGLLALALVAALVVLARPTAAPRLVTYHGGIERNGLSLGPAPSGQPVVDWIAQRPGPIDFGVMPLVADGKVIVADSTGVTALDEWTGAQLWQMRIDGVVRGTPVIAGDLVIAGTDKGALVAFDLDGGRERWRTTVGSPILGSLIEADGTVYVADLGGILGAYDVATGERRWMLDVGAPVIHGTAIADGVLYVGATGRGLTAIELRTRQPLWTEPLGAGDVSTPTVGDGRVLVGRGLGNVGAPHDLVALDVQNGQLLWSFASPEGLQVYPGALAVGVAYAVSGDGDLTALDSATGDLLWTGRTGGRIGTGASVVGDEVIVTSEDRFVHAFSLADGAERWKVAIPGSPTTPAVIDGRVFVGTVLGAVVSIADAP